MNQVVRPENESENCQISGKYEYILHPAAKLTLQIFNTRTMSSFFLTAQETLDLLDYLTRHRSQIAAVTKDEAK